MSKRTPPTPPLPVATRRRKADPPPDALAVLRGLLGGPGSTQATPDRVLNAMLARATKSELIGLIKSLATEAAARRPVGRTPSPRATRDDPLAAEREIVWLEDVSHLSHVHEITRVADSRLGPVAGLSSRHRVIGYTQLDPQSLRGTEGFLRRVFVLYPGEGLPGGAIPEGAVDPRSVEPGRPARELRPTDGAAG